MELKFVKDSVVKSETSSSNRTFMELKYLNVMAIGKHTQF